MRAALKRKTSVAVRNEKALGGEGGKKKGPQGHLVRSRDVERMCLCRLHLDGNKHKRQTVKGKKKQNKK